MGRPPSKLEASCSPVGSSAMSRTVLLAHPHLGSSGSVTMADWRQRMIKAYGPAARALHGHSGAVTTNKRKLRLG